MWESFSNTEIRETTVFSLLTLVNNQILTFEMDFYFSQQKKNLYGAKSGIYERCYICTILCFPQLFFKNNPRMTADTSRLILDI